MKKVVECVPNFSEGKDKKKIRQIAGEIKKIKEAKLLDVSSDRDHNRTVITFAGELEAVKRAAFLAIAKSCELIDMASHKGEHPRIGACDICPFVPISGVMMEECVNLARELGAEIGESLGIPVYLYGEAAKLPERKNLAAIRSGEYEGLEEKLKDWQWQPDYGPAVFNKRAGATVIGARELLIAFNVNLMAESKRAVDIISGLVRELGMTLISREGKKVRIPGVFKTVKARGVFLKERGIYQVSMNLTNYKIVPPHEVFETIKRVSPGLAEVLGSEIVGLVPKEAILMAGRFYLSSEASAKEDSPQENSEKKLIASAVKNLGLNSLKRFNPKKKIIEYLL